MERRDSKLKVFLKYIAIGGSANLISRTLFAPLERFKLIMQVKDLANIPAKDQYRGLTHYLMSVPSREGLRGYWRGNSANIYKILSSTFFRFALHHRIRSFIMPTNSENLQNYDLILRTMLTSTLSGSVALIAAFPFDQARLRLAADFRKKGDKRVYYGVTDCINKGVKDHGIKGLYKGLTIALLGMIPYQLIAFTTHDLLINNLPRQDDEPPEYIKFVEFFGVGSISALIAQTVVYPIDTIRRRMMIDGARDMQKKYSGSLNCLTQTIKEQGALSLYRGCAVNIVRTVPSVAVQFTIYDWLCDTLGTSLDQFNIIS